MKMHAALIAAAVLAAPAAFAQTAVQSSTGMTVSSGTGIVVTPGVPSSMVMPAVATSVAAPGTVVTTLPAATINGAVVAQAGTQQIVTGPSQTIVTRYWLNVPPGVENDPEFQRWQRLR